MLSVATIPTVIAPAIHAPAAFGPVSTSPAGNTASGPTAPGATFTLTITIVPVIGQLSGHGITETFTFIEGPTASGVGSSPASSGGGSGSSGVGSGPMSTSPTVETPSITPLTPAILSNTANVVPVIIVVPQPVAYNFAPSSIPATTLAVLATATAEEQPIGPPVLGQGFESGQTQGIEPRFQGPEMGGKAFVPLEPTLPAIDVIEPHRPELVIPPAGQPEQPAPPAPPRNPAQPDAVPAQPLAFEDWGQTPEFPILSPASESRTEVETPSWSMAAVIGTAAIAGGGYHLVLGGSSRFNQRWLPTRRSSDSKRGRKLFGS